MKRTLIAVTFSSACTLAIVMLTSFKPVDQHGFTKKTTKTTAPKKEWVSFFAHDANVLSDGTTYTGTVIAEGAIDKTGTNVMSTQLLGMALHCTFIATFPDGTLTIRMNCNMKTFNGRWKIIEGTGAYENMKGEGSLVMPNDVDEILSGYIYQ